MNNPSRIVLVTFLLSSLIGCGISHEHTPVTKDRFQDRVATEFGEQRWEIKRAEMERGEHSRAIQTNTNKIRKNKEKIDGVDKMKDDTIKKLQCQMEEKHKQQAQRMQRELKRRTDEMKEQMQKELKQRTDEIKEQMQKELKRRPKVESEKSRRLQNDRPRPKKLRDGTLLLGPADAIVHINERIIRLAKLESALYRYRAKYKKERDYYKDWISLPQYTEESQSNYRKIAKYCTEEFARIAARKQKLLERRAEVQRLIDNSSNDLILVPPELQLSRLPRLYPIPRRGNRNEQ